MRMSSYLKIASGAAAVFLFSLASHAGDNKNNDPDQIGNRDAGKGLNIYSIEKEIALGKGLAQQIERQAKIIDEPQIAEYVNRLGQNLVRNSDAKVPFTIKVIDTEDVNAFALPGGFFYVNSGLILKADTEAELAGVMAHEIAHVAWRHGTRQASRATVMQMATIPLIFYGGWTGYGIRQAANLVIPLSYLQFSKGFESEADKYGLQYMYKAGYDPNAFVDFFEKLQSLEKKKPGTMSKLFSDHPPTGSRIVAVQKEIQEELKERPEYVETTSEFNDVKAKLLAMHNRRANDPVDPSKPHLNRSPGSSGSDNGSGGSVGDDDRPTLKRRPDDVGGSSSDSGSNGTSSASSSDDRPTLKKAPSSDSGSSTGASSSDDDRPTLKKAPSSGSDTSTTSSSSSSSSDDDRPTLKKAPAQPDSSTGGTSGTSSGTGTSPAAPTGPSN
ncbi:MAG TPA: M48 family metallopeptidase [Bryobacteraceae bacterium]|jgi:predicted Zn-dependent protease